MPQLLDPGLFSVADVDGSIGAGWKIYTYATGTTTPKASYPTSADAIAGTNANSNPVIIPADGRIPAVWTNGAFKVILANSSNLQKASREIPDNLAQLSYTASGAGAVSTTVSAVLNGIITPEQFGAVGDGTTDDYTAFVNAAAAALAAKVPLVLSDKTYVIAQDTLALPSITWQNNGAVLKFTKNTTTTAPAITIPAGFIADAIAVSIPTGTARPYGIIATGDDITIGQITLNAVTQQAQFVASTDYAVKLTSGARFNVGRIVVTNYDRAVVVDRTTDSRVGGIDVTSYVRGVQIVDNVSLYVGKSHVQTRSANASQTAGHNSLLTTSSTLNQTNVVIEDFIAENAGEHGIRIGAGPQKNISLIRPRVFGCQGAGIKALGTDNAAPVSGEYHENLIIDCPIVEDVGSGSGGATNLSGIQIERVNKVQINNPIIRKRVASTSCQIGMRFYGVADALVTNPIILSAASDGIQIFADDSGAVSAPTVRVQVLGGLIKDCGDDGIQMSATSSIDLNAIVFDRIQLITNGNRGFVAASGTGGTFTNCFLSARFILNVVDSCILTAAGWTLDCYGDDTYGSGTGALATIAADNGSQWSNPTTLNIRKAGAWTAL